jgi:hypothetical protein
VATVIALRSVIFAVIAVGLSAAAHVLAGGGSPPAAGVAVSAALTACLSLPLFRKALRPLALLGVVGPAQGVLHPVFNALTTPTAHAHSASVTNFSLTMLAAHIGSAVLAALLVVAIDPLVRSMTERWALRVARRPVLVISSCAQPALPAEDTISAATEHVLLAAPRRGPPAR